MAIPNTLSRWGSQYNPVNGRQSVVQFRDNTSLMVIRFLSKAFDSPTVIMATGHGQSTFHKHFTCTP